MRRLFELSMLVVVVLSFVVVGCDADTADDEVEGADLPYNAEYDKTMFGATPTEEKTDTANGLKGLPVSVDGSSTAVWEVENAWEDTDTPAAKEAGIAWEANSGLTWDEKYQAWIDQMVKMDGHDTYYQTFALTTPYGRTMPAPNLECAETALFLRATFASWYKLPFMVVAYDGGWVYFGHFGARTATGRYKKLPYFKSWYKDYSDMTAEEYTASWPTDDKLKTRKISSSGDDENAFLGEDKFAGAYFDQIFLNKRTGHFMVYLLTYFGSMHLATTSNTFNLAPEAVKPGDVLLERWQKHGIGHTLVVKKVVDLGEGQLDAELVSGSMPRRQPKWEDGPSSKYYFTNTYCGGPGENDDGDAYAALGGGLKRWRTTKNINGYWYNVVIEANKPYWINSSDTEAIAGRIDKFKTILGELSPEAKKQMLLNKIQDNRNHLKNYPASCSARERREEAFEELYALMSEHFGMTKAQVDAQYRVLDDYVFAELEYTKSKTCCWNSSTSTMYEIIMDYAKSSVKDPETGECLGVPVFMNDGGYGLFSTHASELDQASEWVPWSEDEPCSQRNVEKDTEAAHDWTPACEYIDILLGEASADPCADTFADNHDKEHAAPLEAGEYAGLQVCSDVADWYVVQGDGYEHTLTISFSHSSGDLDCKLYDADGVVLEVSESTHDQESLPLSGTGTFYIEVYGYSGAANGYSLSFE